MRVLYLCDPFNMGQDITRGQFFHFEFSFKTSCDNKAKEPNLPYNLLINGVWKNRWIPAFLMDINVNSLDQDLNLTTPVCFLEQLFYHGQFSSEVYLV